MNEEDSLSSTLDLQRVVEAVQQSGFYQLLGMEIVELTR